MSYIRFFCPEKTKVFLIMICKMECSWIIECILFLLIFREQLGLEVHFGVKQARWLVILAMDCGWGPVLLLFTKQHDLRLLLTISQSQFTHEYDINNNWEKLCSFPIACYSACRLLGWWAIEISQFLHIHFMSKRLFLRKLMSPVFLQWFWN